MKLTKEQNALANKLRDQGLPPEWAILVAQNTPASYHGSVNLTPSSMWLTRAFVFGETPEGHEFWWDMMEAARAELVA